MLRAECCEILFRLLRIAEELGSSHLSLHAKVSHRSASHLPLRSRNNPQRFAIMSTEAPAAAAPAGAEPQKENFADVTLTKVSPSTLGHMRSSAH